MFSKTILLLLLAVAFSATASAQDFVVKVNGIVCEFCSYGVAKKVSKLPFVDRAKYNNGVDVKVQEQMVTVAVQADAMLDKAQLYKAIESGGYHPVAIFSRNADGSLSKYTP